MEDYKAMSDEEFYKVRDAVEAEADARSAKFFNGPSSKVLKQLLTMRSIDPDFDGSVWLLAEYYVTGSCNVPLDEFLDCVNADTGVVDKEALKELVSGHVYIDGDFMEDVGVDNRFEVTINSIDEDAVRHLCKQTYFVPV